MVIQFGSQQSPPSFVNQIRFVSKRNLIDYGILNKQSKKRFQLQLGKMDVWDFRVKISGIQLLCEVITFSLQSQRTRGLCVRFLVCIMASGQGWIIEVFDYGRKRLAWPGMEGRRGVGGARWWTLQQGGRNVFLETLLGHFWNRKWEISGECVYERRRSISARRAGEEGGSEENQLVPLEWVGTHARTSCYSSLAAALCDLNVIV